VLLIAVIWLVYKSTKAPKIAYVKSADLIYSYDGMKEAQQKQQAKTSGLKSGLDTLQLDFQKAVAQYNVEFPKLSKEDRRGRENILAAQQENLRTYAQNIQQEIQKEDEQLTQGVLNQVNSFVEDYAKKKGYTMVLGTTTSGNILYAEGYMDITKEVLEAINAGYRINPNLTASYENN
jgi:Skp family chaperone for outer membrane proteins